MCLTRDTRTAYREGMNTTHETDVEALAEALRSAGVEVGYAGGDAFRETVAKRLIASDWLAADRARVRAEALLEAADAMPFGYSHAAALLRERAREAGDDA